MMKKKFIGIIGMIAIGIGITLHQGVFYQPNQKNAIRLANIEALVDEENENGKYDCYNTITSDDARSVRYCPTCEKVPGIDVWYSFRSECSK